MKYITYYHKHNADLDDIGKDYKHDYNTDNMSEEELREIVDRWNEEDKDVGFHYYLVEED